MLLQRTWRPDALGRLLLGLLASMAIGMLISGILGVSSEDGVLTMVVSTLCFHGATLFLVHLFLWEHGLSWRDAFGFNAPRPSSALMWVVITVMVALPCSWALNYLSAQFLTQVHVDPTPQKAVQTIQVAVDMGAQVYLAGMAVVVVPFAEELLFRGILYPMLRHAVALPWALAISSVLFGAMHLNLMTFVPLTFLGLMLALLYEVTGNLLAPILAHSLFNLANYFLLSFVPVEAWL